MRIAHAEIVHVIEGVADVVHAGAALADALRHEPGAPVQVELADVGRVGRIGEEGEGMDPPPAAERRLHQAWLVDATGHLAAPQAAQCPADMGARDAEGHAPAGAAPAKPHDQPGFSERPAVARGPDAEGAMVAVHQGDGLLAVGKAGRPDE
jgi:hypothetical protein